MSVRIEKAVNGYVMDISHGTEVYDTLDHVFNRLLAHFEGRAESFYGDSYGKVEVDRHRRSLVEAKVKR